MREILGDIFVACLIIIVFALFALFIWLIIEYVKDDHESTKPLIKDKKARKAVRAWAKLCGISVVRKYNEYGIGAKGALILINQTAFVPLEYCKDYTITELCGKEEE